MFVMTAPFGSCETHKLTWLQSCQPWSYLRLVAASRFDAGSALLPKCGARSESRVSCGQYTVNDLPTFENCRHNGKGWGHRFCGCPIHVEGTLCGEMIRKWLDVRNWEAAQP